MSGPYNYGFRPHGQTPLSPDTPTSASYKTNVKRTKTKKWVEAKTQNYDGDDWGNDFDDEEPEEPVPPLRPMPGVRQPSPSQTTAATLPSNQPPTPQSAGPVSMMRPPQPPVNESGPSSSPRATAGLPPLQIQTQPQPAPAVMHPGSNDKGPPIISGPSSMDSASEKGPYEQLVSPQSAGIGPGVGAFAGRHEYPQGTSSPVSGRRTSPAPPQSQATRFPPRKSSMGQHDADRQSANSRSSSTQRPWIEQRSASPANTRSPGTPSNAKAPSFVRPSDIYRRLDDDKDKERGSTESGRPSLDCAGGPRTDRSVSPAKSPARGLETAEQAPRGSEDAAPGSQRPALETVAERKSEYGFDRLIAQPQPQAQPPSSGSPQQGNLSVPEPQVQRPSNEEAEQQRRYSTSPRLPDLARMSLFGDDFFSNPAKFADDAPPMPSLKQNPDVYSTSGGSTPMEKAAAAAVVPAEVRAPLSTTSSTPQRTESPRVPEQPDRKESVSPAQASSVRDSPQQPVAPTLASLPSRPSLPGGWVTETRSDAGEQTPPAVVEKKVSVDPGEVSPISDNEDDGMHGSGVATVKDRVSIPFSISETSNQGADKPAADIKPLAPLNPRPSDNSPSDNSPSDFVAPEKLQRESTMSTVTSPSPVKESDKLREEIMRSLSPVRPTSDLNDTKGQAGEDNGPRESTYLHGVYDDYWAATDDKPDMPNLPSKQPGQDMASAATKDISDVPPLSPRKETTDPAPALGRRFSWEAGSEQVAPEPAEAPKDPLSDTQPPPASVAVASPSTPAQAHQPAQPAQPEESREADHSQPPTTTDATHIEAPPNTSSMSHQVSQVSSVPRDRLGSEVMEPPSPVSVMTDKNNASAAPTRRLSLAEEKSMVRVSSNPVSPSPPPGDHPALAQSSEATPPPASPVPPQQQPAAPVQVATFREIMELSSASDRINKYNETRAQFASMDSGLDNWLITLKYQHPEHANATASFGTNVSSVSQPQSSPTSSQPASQQPYYQQYLNASSTNVSAVPSGRPPAASAPMASSHSPSSDFKHSSGQVGAKGKELLLAAGKAGKGLLSKGKNKLRGTGDKSDSSPPPAQSQSKAKQERRTSWGISLGTRSPPRADGYGHAHSASHSGSFSGPTSNPQTIPEHPATPTPPPQLPQTSRISPFDALTQGNQASAWAPPRPQTPKHVAGARRDSESEPVSPVSDTQSMSAPKAQPETHGKTGDEGVDGGGGDLQVPRPISKTQPSWDPFTGTPLVEEEGFEVGQSRDPSPHVRHTPNAPSQDPLVQQAQTAQAAPGAKNTTDDDDQSDDWVVVSPQSPPSGQVRLVSPESPQLSRPFQPVETSREILHHKDNSGVAPNQNVASSSQQAHQQPQYQAQYQTRQQLPSQQQSQSPQRQSSFVGLPPIRRSSTFGVNLTRRAKTRFSIDEDDENGNGNVFVSSPVSATADQHGPGAIGSAHVRGPEPNLPPQPTQSAQPARIETGLSASRKDSAMSHHAPSATSTQAATLATESTGVDWRPDDEKRPLGPGASFRPGRPVPDPINTNFAAQNEGRTGGAPYGPGMRTQQGITSAALGGNPIQHLPPQGPWKLEESHLSEPLLPASRSRQSGSSVSPHQPFFGYDKETGVPTPAGPRPETQLPPRQKFSEVPPSSAQRYPGLFSPPQGYLNPGSPTGSRSSYDLYSRDNAPLQRTQTIDSEVSSMEPSGDDDRGRSKRGSGLFKEIGGRFSRTSSSRERHDFKAEEAPPGHPAASDAPGDGESEFSVATGEVQERERRRSSFLINLRGSKPGDATSPQGREADGFTSSPKASPNPGASPQIQQPNTERKRSFLGPAVNDSSSGLPSLSRSSTSTAGNESTGGAMVPPKKRFSGFAGKMFNRSSSQQDLQPPQKPWTSHSVASSFQSNHFGAPVNQPGLLAPRGRERSNTTGSGPYNLQQANKHLKTVEEDRGRRSSAGGFFSGLFGHRSSKTQETQQPAQPGFHQNGQVPGQPRTQQAGHQMPPSSLGPNRQMGPPRMRSPQQQVGQQPQQSFPPQGPAVQPVHDSGSQTHSQAPPQLIQKRPDGSFLPSSQPPQPSQSSQHPAPASDTQHSLIPNMTGAQPIPDAESDRHQDHGTPGSEAQTFIQQQIEPNRPLETAQPPVQGADISAIQAPREQNSPALSRPKDQQQPSPSIPKALDHLSHLGQLNEQVHAQQNRPNIVATAHTPPARLESGQERMVNPRTPPLPQAPENTIHALGIQGASPVRRLSDQPASLDAPGVRAQSPNVLVSQSDMSQRSCISTSPRPPAASQMRPPPAPAAPLGQKPALSPLQGSLGPIGPRDVQQYDQMDRPMPSFTPHSHQQPPSIVGRDLGQHDQAWPQMNQQSSAPQFPAQGQQTSTQGASDQGQQSSMSKWFKNRSSTQALQSQSHQGTAKESTAKSILNAFKRSSKQPEPRPQQPQHMPQHSPGTQTHPLQTRPEQQTLPPSGAPTQRSPQQMQGPHLMYQQQRQSPSLAASFGQRPPPQHGLSSANSDVSQGLNQMPQYQRAPIDSAMTRAVPAAAGSNPGMPQPQPYVEPQYDEVPIPKGYAAVHGEGGVAPSPYDIGRPSPPAQYPLHQTPPLTQHLSQPSVVQRHPSEVSSYSQPPSSVPQSQHHIQDHIQPEAPLQADRRISSASHQSNLSRVSHGASPGFTGPSNTHGHNQQYFQEDARGLRLASENAGRGTALNPQINFQGHPQGHPQGHLQSNPQVTPHISHQIDLQNNVQTQPLQEQPVPATNAAGPYGALPQIQPSQSRELEGPTVSSPHEGQIPAGDVNQISSNAAASLRPHAQTLAHGLAVDTSSVTGNNSRSASPGTQVVGDRSATSEPPAPGASRLSVNVQSANQDTPEDIYDSPPRLLSGPPPPPINPITATRTGQSQVSESSADEAPRNVTHTNGNVNGANSTTLTRGKSTRAELEDTEDERMRTMRLEAQEEKILVDPYEEIQSGTKYRKEEDTDAPQMSATSYPGQEWNPYGAGGYEDWD